MGDVSELAAQLGIETDYVDASGVRRAVPPPALARLCDAIGSHRPPPRTLLPPVVVLRRGRSMQVPLPALGGGIVWSLARDDAVIASGDGAPIALAADCPDGIYRLRVQARPSSGPIDETALLIVTPARAYRGRDGKLWALAVQLYGVRSRRNWGHGDFTDLAALLDLAADLGAAGIGVNPLHALFDDRPECISPYAPNSRLFLNPLYIDVEAVPEFPGLKRSGLQSEVTRLRQQALVDYAGVAAAKRKGLRLAHAAFRRKPDRARRAAFEAFRQRAGSALTRFAGFELLRRRHAGAWWDWPHPWRSPDAQALAALRASDAEEIEFFEFVQWIADEQLAACAAKARARHLPIGLYLDIAVGVDAGGADAWSEQGAILHALSIGAPPDPLNSAGQNWGLAGFNPAGLIERAFAPFRGMLQSAMCHAGAVRLDHVLGLKRLFMIPHGMRAGEGAYLRQPFEALLAVVAQESVTQRCIVIGEDLGTVPENFRETLADWGIWSYRVMMFERDAAGAFLPPERYGADSLVTFNTHDLATFAGWLSGHDLEVKRAVGLDPGESDEQRAAAIMALRAALTGGPGAVNELTATARHLAATPSRLLVLAMEDVLGLQDQPNIPGTVDEHPNWRRRLPVLLEDLARVETLAELARVMTEAGRNAAAGPR
jgi:4-alpha-glucanotransferase